MPVAKQFALSIDLGHEAMYTPADIAAALVAAATEVEYLGAIEPTMAVAIRDADGNTVGHWAVQA